MIFSNLPLVSSKKIKCFISGAHLWLTVASLASMQFPKSTGFGTANKDRSTVNYHQSSAFDHPYLSSNDHCDWWLFKEIFSFINVIFISQKFFWAILIFFSWNFNTFTKHNEQICFLFIYSFFTCCFIIILRIDTSPFCTFPMHVNTRDKSVLFFIVVSQSLYIISLSTFCIWTGLLKQNPLLSQFSWWSLNFLWLDLHQLE